ncbi:hypothetical protein CB1_056242009 [Camelus ferus]|nr:hypothetical protein CB1_056242009 [Camelus ferus]
MWARTAEQQPFQCLPWRIFWKGSFDIQGFEDDGRKPSATLSSHPSQEGSEEPILVKSWTACELGALEGKDTVRSGLRKSFWLQSKGWGQWDLKDGDKGSTSQKHCIMPTLSSSFCATCEDVKSGYRSKMLL